MNSRRSAAVGFLLLVLLGMAAMFVQVIWVPLYRTPESADGIARPESPALQVEVERQDGAATRSWTIADQQAIARLRAGLQSAETSAPGEPPPSEQKYRLRIKRADSRIDEYEVVLGTEGRMNDQIFVIRRSGGTPVYGTAYNTPELRSALQRVLVPPAPK